MRARTVPELIEELLTGFSGLVSERMRRLRSLAFESGRHILSGALIGLLAGSLILIGALTLSLEVIRLLGQVLPSWAAALIMGGTTLAGGILLGYRSARRIRRALGTSAQMAASLDEDARWARTMIHEAAKRDPAER
jgi:hypothetical protein